MLNDFYCPSLVHEHKYKLSPTGTYYVPPQMSYEEYIEFIKVRYVMVAPFMVARC